MSDIIVVKIGTESLVDFENSEKISVLIHSIAEKIQQGVFIVLVTSGAVQFGREFLGVEKNDYEDKAILASVGNPQLFTAYQKKFQAVGISAGQILLTHATLEKYSEQRENFISIINTFHNKKMLPIINENDVLSNEELQALHNGADNDRNAFLIAKIVQAKSLILLTNTNGVYLNKDDPRSRISSMHSDELTLQKIDQLCSKNITSKTGTGGMASKLSVAYEAGAIGIDVHIGNGTESGLQNIGTGGTNIWPISQYPNFQN